MGRMTAFPPHAGVGPAGASRYYCEILCRIPNRGASVWSLRPRNVATMATKTPARTKPRTPRVMVTLSPEARVLLDRMAKATRTPKAALVAELVDAGLPAMATTLDAIELVKAGKNHEAERLLSRFALQASSQLSQQQLELQEVIDARTVKGKRAKRGAGGRTTT